MGTFNSKLLTLEHIKTEKSRNMEMPHIGKHCQLKSCNQLDYLPFNCKHCRFSFCLGHWKPEDHSCSEIKKINLPENSSQHKTSQHSILQTKVTTTTSSGHSSSNKPEKPKKKRKQNPCNMPDCNGYNLVKMGCGDCGVNFCVKHRFPEEHECLRRFNSRFSRLLAVN